jgi:hypothetical protein
VSALFGGMTRLEAAVYLGVICVGFVLVAITRGWPIGAVLAVVAGVALLLGALALISWDAAHR